MGQAANLYYDVLMWLADHVPVAFIAAYDAMGGGNPDSKTFLTKEQQTALKEKYAEVTA